MRRTLPSSFRLSSLLVLAATLAACGGSSGHGGLGFASDDATLSALVTSEGVLAPPFSPGVLSYTVDVGAIPVTITVTPTANHPGARIRVNGTLVASGSASGPIALAPPPAPTPISVAVLAEDGSTTRTYTLVVTRAAVTVSQQAYLKASNTGLGDAFGSRVAISGNTLVVGAPSEDSAATGVGGDQSSDAATDAGAAYVFVRTGATWTQQAYLKASNTGGGDRFGSSVAIDLDTIVVGAIGEASSVGGDEADDAAPGAGAAYVFVRGGGVWTQQAYLKASNPGVQDQFGFRVAIGGETLVVGAPYEDSNATGVGGDQVNSAANDAGAAYVFVRGGTVWTQQAYLKASNTGLGDQFGLDLGISGETIVVGASNEDSNATGVLGNELDNTAVNSGAAYVFVRSGAVWTQQAYLKASNTGAGDQFGLAVAVSLETIVVGAIGEASGATGVDGGQSDGFAGAGAAYVFARAGTVWTQQAYLKASNTDTGDGFGTSVGISGDAIVVGARSEDSSATGVGGNQADNTATSSGAAYLFARSGTAWTAGAYLKASNTGGQDQFGAAVGISGDTIVAGAASEDSDATGVGGIQANEAGVDSGAAYVIR